MPVRHFVVVCGLGAAFAAGAQPLPPPSVTIQASFNIGASETGFDFGSFVLTQPGFGSIGVTASGVPSPLVQAVSSIDGGAAASDFGRGIAIVNYNVRIDGPQGLVPVLVGASGSASGTATAGASFAVQASWSLFFDQANPLAADSIHSGQIFGTGFEQSFGRTIEVTMITNLAYTVSMVADAAAAASALGDHAVAQATVDPVFALGGGVDPALYSFVFSAGIGNTAPVPGPNGFVAMALGLLGLAIARWRPVRASVRRSAASARQRE